jgi:hypothetical protein
VGTGDTAKKGLFSLINKIRKDKEILNWARAGRLLFVPLWAFADGVDFIRKEIGDIVTIQASRNLDDEDRVFSKTAKIFETEDERKYSEEIFRHIGQQLIRDHPLGWGNCQSLVIFENTVPNNTLPPLWCSGTVDERPWIPLFQRP